uniref:Ig-like domain-containing protein n=1 Tax=Hucho hucho TaxID=62062 RepID=A0A4W5RFS0_9TELE
MNLSSTIKVSPAACRSEMILFILIFLDFDASSWTAEVPSSVSGLQGSCIVIPCSFNYPEPEKKPSKLTGTWFKNQYDYIYHPDSSNVITDYRGRTELVGDLWQKNCSLRIDRLNHSDIGPFTFRIEIEDHTKYSYINDKVSIAVSSPDPPSLSVREEVKVEEEVSASCSVFHSCPSEHPLFTWSHSGTASVHSQQLAKGHWEVTSSLNFSSTITDHNQPLICTAAYRGGKMVNSSKTLNVKCKWTTPFVLTTLFGRFTLSLLARETVNARHSIEFRGPLLNSSSIGF